MGRMPSSFALVEALLRAVWNDTAGKGRAEVIASF